MPTFARLLQAAFAGTLVVVVSHGVAAAPAASAPHIQLPWTNSEPDGVQAPGAALADGITGTILWSRQADVPVPIASIAKVMTAMVAITAGDLDRPITVPAAAIAYCVANDGSTAGLASGEVLTTHQLLYALMLPSGCDAAYTLAEAYGPGQDGFIAKMNDAARLMGLAATYFADPSGLPVPTDGATYSTPADLIALGLRAMSLPVFREVAGSQSYHLPAGPANRDHVWQTTNLLLRAYPGTIGIKTGSTDAAGACLLFESVRAGIPLIGVVLHSSPGSGVAAKNDAEHMLNWAYDPILTALPIH
ncbi:D-alanyl-D-alanine carboxypeptidase family protein [Nocardia seriolae]|uniref:Peptidase S11 n=1 Tax=Nocardia seriolae TaxID=37332 RepID=A0A0B8N4J4_9NOCA|nr:D-alanyl-D-alanine carboxypeptidase [Nocardia seriolae]APA98713.1 Serine-type D-Ala-D-Ala carboxypeptidase [Nocardia seriolae]MTJ63787.1 D-alanyl-D-alanine carboxypeptidase [Nocardia seriolae]MTJ72250.1 D-alanyl-D-alanine carboxypeptidase [Nocardia seriolae]MTJ88349.1 D-alanyl-D-alanine carboxypeptidase [Nocardia seriolae]MTK32334.1 D-alanyl-D-alanine carboxypeptidase [Nocardia seriolae]